MSDPFEGMEDVNYPTHVGEYITLTGSSNVIIRRDRFGVQATYTKCEDGGPENCGKWMQENGQELVLENKVTFGDNEVTIGNLTHEDYQAHYALQGANTVYRVLFPLH